MRYARCAPRNRLENLPRIYDPVLINRPRRIGKRYAISYAGIKRVARYRNRSRDRSATVNAIVTRDERWNPRRGTTGLSIHDGRDRYSLPSGIHDFSATLSSPRLKFVISRGIPGGITRVQRTRFRDPDEDCRNPR